MTVERFLGGSWAAVHGPRGAREFLLWCLDSGFRGVVPEPSLRDRAWHELRDARHDLPVAIPAVRVSSAVEAAAPREAGLASRNAGDRTRAAAAVAGAIDLATHLGTPRIVLEPGVASVAGEVDAFDLGDRHAGWTADRYAALAARRAAVLDASLDLVCRGLFELMQANPDIEFCLAPSRHVFGLGEPVALAAIFEDLGGKGLRYWHDTAVAARRAVLSGGDQGAWLDPFSKYLAGMSLSDTADGGLHLPPGAGGVDFPLVAAYVVRSAGMFPATLELDPGVDPAEIPSSHAFLEKYGL